MQKNLIEKLYIFNIEITGGSEKKFPKEETRAEEKAPKEDKPPNEEDVSAEDKPPKEEDASAEDKPPNEEDVSAEVKPPEEEDASAEDKPPNEEDVSAEDKPPKEEYVSTEDKPPKEEDASAEAGSGSGSGSGSIGNDYGIGSSESVTGPIKNQIISQVPISELGNFLRPPPGYNFDDYAVQIDVTDEYGQNNLTGKGVDSIDITFGLFLKGEAGIDVILRNNIPFNLFAVFAKNASAVNKLNLSFFTTLICFGVMSQSDYNINTYKEVAIKMINSLNLELKDTIQETVCIYDNEIACLKDAKLSFIFNIIHALAPGTWAKMFEFIADYILDEVNLALDKKSSEFNGVGSVYDLFVKWADDAKKTGRITEEEANFYIPLAVGCYDELLAHESNAYKAHGVTANLWHTYPNEKDPNENDSFVATSGSIIHTILRLKSEGNTTWEEGLYDELIEKSTFTDENDTLCVVNLWEKIRTDYGYNDWAVVEEPNIVDEDTNEQPNELDDVTENVVDEPNIVDEDTSGQPNELDDVTENVDTSESSRLVINENEEIIINLVSDSNLNINLE